GLETRRRSGVQSARSTRVRASHQNDFRPRLSWALQISYPLTCSGTRQQYSAPCPVRRTARPEKTKLVSRRIDLRVVVFSAPMANQPRGELVIQTIAMPKDTNPNGDIFGGWLTSQMDLGSGILAAKTA